MVSPLLDIFDHVWVYLAANPVTATEAAFVAQERAAGYALTDIQKVGAALYPELVLRLVIKTPTFEAIRVAFVSATVDQRARVINDVRAYLALGPFRSAEIQVRLVILDQAIVDVTRRLTNAPAIRAALDAAFPPSESKDDGLLTFDLGVDALQAQSASLQQHRLRLIAEAFR